MDEHCHVLLYIYMYKDCLPLLDKQIDTSHASCKKHGSILRKTTTTKKESKERSVVFCLHFPKIEQYATLQWWCWEEVRRKGSRPQRTRGTLPPRHIYTHTRTDDRARIYKKQTHAHTHRYIYTRMWGERKRQKERSASLDNTTCTRCHTHTHTKKRKEVLRNIHAPHKIVLYNIFGCRGQKQHSLRLKPVCLGELT